MRTSDLDLDLIIRVKRHLIALLHDGERTLSRTDPNHPYTRFGAAGSLSGNLRRLGRAFNEILDRDTAEEDLRPVIRLMFDEDEPQESKTCEVLRRYREYVTRQASGASSSDDSSDDDSD